jgi:uncharacterized SAM-binding protein YcdF (DUF218 family)
MAGMAFFFFLGMLAGGHILAHWNTAPVEDIDIHILFKGDESRVKAFYLLLDKHKADLFAIPGASDKALQYWDKKYDQPVSATPVIKETFTTSTFEDVLQADRIIRQNGFKTVLLVTSDYHMARAWSVLRVKTLGAGVKIHTAAVSEKSSPGLYAKQVFNESAKFWGSMAEYIYHGVTGRLMTDNERMNRYFEKLRKVILFKT